LIATYRKQALARIKFLTLLAAVVLPAVAVFWRYCEPYWLIPAAAKQAPSGAQTVDDRSPRAGARNVLLISIDTLRADSLGPIVGDDGMPPPLAKLMANAARFNRTYSTASWTLPAHGSMMTGLYPDRHGANRPTLTVSPDVLTIAQALRAQGFETVAFTGGGYLDNRFGFSSGFMQYDKFVDPAYAARHLPRDGATEPITVADRFDRGIAYLQQRRAGDPPFFMFLHTFAVHNYFRQRASLDPRVPSADPLAALRFQGCLQGRITCLPWEWVSLENCYHADIGYTESDLARVLDALDQTGLRASTLIVITADHGEGFDPAWRRIHHGGRLHADVIRVPMLIEGPGVVAGPRETPASLVDVMPTILAYLGVPVPAGLDGRALPLTRPDDAAQSRTLYAMEHAFSWTPDGQTPILGPIDGALAVAVITPDRWYIRGPEGEELYAQSDVDQRRNIADTERMDEFRAVADARSVPQTAVAPAKIDETVKERLRALGYNP